MKSDFAAATHVDWSSRLQTIDLESPSRARKILEAFFQLSSCPMLLNTSFNIRGEPIVNHPDEAISCFLKTEMDVLYIGGFIVRKSEQLTAPRLYEED
jgi:carbamoyltransferase